jgi:hypothetical protein
MEVGLLLGRRVVGFGGDDREIFQQGLDAIRAISGYGMSNVIATLRAL